MKRFSWHSEPGLFFGRVTKNRMEMRKDECKTYKDIIDREG